MSRAIVDGGYDMRVVVPRVYLRGRYIISADGAAGNITEEQKGSTRLRPTAYDAESVVTSLKKLHTYLLAELDNISLTLDCAAITPREGLNAQSESASTWSISAEAKVLHYARSESVMYMTTANGGDIRVPAQMETYLVLGIAGDATMMLGAQTHTGSVLDTEGYASARMSIHASPSAILKLPGDAASDTLRTLAETDTHTLDELDSMTIDEIDWVHDSSGDERIDPVVIHEGGGE